ncbi:MAG: sulfatase-like hydrolase/transferase, partial [Proteobacteria bacterium]|nr:sulfatase-like hydrolase/transferase [Pseudomonadota bacterium]
GQHFDKGDLIIVTVTPNDGEDDGIPLVSEQAVVQNTHPEINAVTLSTLVPIESDTLSVSISVDDADDDSVAFNHSWAVNGAVVANTQTLDGQHFDKGDVITVSVTPHDGEDDGAPLVSDEALAQNTAPELGAVTLSTLVPVESDTLSVTVSDIDDDDNDSVALKHAWAVNGTVVANTQTLNGQHFDKGDLIAVTVTPNDGEDDGAPLTSDLAVVENSLPEIGQVTLSNLHPTVMDTIGCAIVGIDDRDGDDITYHYEWQVNGIVVSTTNSLTGDQFSRGNAIQVFVTPDDGTELGIPVSSNVATAINSPPVINSLSLSSSSPTTDEDISYTIDDSDPDGDFIHRDKEWFVNGVLVSSDTTLDHRLFKKGDEITLTITPFDLADLGAAVSVSATVGYTPPQINDIVFSPAELYTDDRLLAWVTPSDTDAGKIDIHYEWAVNGLSVSHDDLNLSGRLFFDKGDIVELVVELDDGETSVYSDAYTFLVGDHPPFAPGVETLPEQPVAGVDSLTCEISADSIDPDNDLVNYTIRWEVDGFPYLGPTETTTIAGDTIPYDVFSGGQDWVCFVTPNDGIQDGRESSSYQPDLTTPPNLLVLLVDDVGVDRIGLYGQNPYPAPTPNIDELAQSGVLFKQAYAQPVCCPTRATMLTGRDTRRYGTSSNLTADGVFELASGEVTLPEVLSEAGYSAAAIGKWHLSTMQSPSGFAHPLVQGFDYYAGWPQNIGETYFESDYYITGVQQDPINVYLTTQETDDAIDQINSLPEPWVIWVGYHAIHTP